MERSWSPGAPRARTPVLLSQRQPFVTLASADLGGPARRLREIAPTLTQLSWQPPHMKADAALGSSFLLVSAGSCAAGTSIAVSSIVVYPPCADRAARAYVYVEERQGAAWLPSKARPFLLLQCPRLPADIRFVEVPPAPARRSPMMRRPVSPPSRHRPF